MSIGASTRQEMRHVACFVDDDVRGEGADVILFCHLTGLGDYVVVEWFILQKKTQRGMQELHRLGKVRTEGKEYEVRDGDVIEFLFSVLG